MIFDTHAHYDDEQFDTDRDELLNSMAAGGVGTIVDAAATVESWDKIVELAEKYSFIYGSVGVHPDEVGALNEENFARMRELLKKEKIVAVGEIGLDYHYDGYSAEKQKKLFISQLELAKKLDIPVIVHSRDASNDTMEILREYKPKGVVHCFSGSAETAKEIIALGMYISFTGVITFKNAKKALRALEKVPTDRLMLETDCPYMAPEPYRGKRCDSSMIEKIAEKAAEIKGTTAQEMLDITCANAMRFFDIV